MRARGTPGQAESRNDASRRTMEVLGGRGAVSLSLTEPSIRDESIAATADGLHTCGCGRYGSQFCAKAANVHVNQMVAARIRIAPHLESECRAREHCFGMSREHREQAELGWSQVDLLIVDNDRSALRCDRDISDMQFGR